MKFPCPCFVESKSPAFCRCDSFFRVKFRIICMSWVRSRCWPPCFCVLIHKSNLGAFFNRKDGWFKPSTCHVYSNGLRSRRRSRLGSRNRCRGWRWCSNWCWSGAWVTRSQSRRRRRRWSTWSSSRAGCTILILSLIGSGGWGRSCFWSCGFIASRSN